MATCFQSSATTAALCRMMIWVLVFIALSVSISASSFQDVNGRLSTDSKRAFSRLIDVRRRLSDIGAADEDTRRGAGNSRGGSADAHKRLCPVGAGMSHHCTAVILDKTLAMRDRVRSGVSPGKKRSVSEVGTNAIRRPSDDREPAGVDSENELLKLELERMPCREGDLVCRIRYILLQNAVKHRDDEDDEKAAFQRAPHDQNQLLKQALNDFTDEDMESGVDASQER